MNRNHNRKPGKRSREAGIALLVTMFALLLLSAIAIGMITMSDTETSVNTNFRDAQSAYYQSVAGLEEARDRLRAAAVSNPAPIAPPAKMPDNTGGIIYLTNPAAGENVQPWLSTDQYFDTELCHDGFAFNPALYNPGNNARCTSAPAGTAWFNNAAVPSVSPKTNTAGALDFKWVRINLKANASEAPYCVNGNCGNTPQARVCWDGVQEQVLPAGKANCTANDPKWKEVYMLTSLSVTRRGSRRMTTMEVVPGTSVPIPATIVSKQSIDTGQALNVTGNVDAACKNPDGSAMAPVSGAQAGSWDPSWPASPAPPNCSSSTGCKVVTPGSGNVTGTPATNPNKAFPYDLPGLIKQIKDNGYSPLDSSVGVAPTGTSSVPNDAAKQAGGSPPARPDYKGGSGTLGVPPTVTTNGSQAITAVTNPGVPKTYYLPNAGTVTLGGTSPGYTGNGALIVEGNLILDVSKGFKFYGLIIATGDIKLVAPSGTVTPELHGIMIAGGQFSAPISNFGGSISFHANPCFVNNMFNNTPLKVVAFQEITY